MKQILLVFILSITFSIGALCQDEYNEPVYDGYKAMVAAAKEQIQLLSIEEFHKTYTNALRVGGEDFVLIDIRTESEVAEGFIPGAFHIQRGTIESRMEKDEVWETFNHTKPQKSDEIILYCRSGSRSALAAKTLKQLGYTNVKSLEGGWRDWSEKYPNLKKVE